VNYPQRAETTYVEPDTVYSDTFFKNVVLSDSFTFNKFDYVKIESKGVDSNFKLITDTTRYTDVYQVDNMRNTFFPIDGRGFDAAYDSSETLMVNKHNFSFTMSMRNSFVYKGGEILRLMGDDDIWVFINKKLAIDLGGLHATQANEIALDTMTAKLGLTVGGTYDIVLFFAERHTTGSNLSVVTNIEFIEKAEGQSVFERFVTPALPGSTPRQSTRPLARTRLTINGVHHVFSIPENTARITVDIFDASGKRVYSANRAAEAAIQSGFPATKQLRTGIYFTRLSCTDQSGKARASTVCRAMTIP
jgi:fibro-slime domain-containing protein